MSNPSTPGHGSSGGPRRVNRLARESSPYLLQHAHNPVDWWAWGPDAFAEARRRGVPILLSIGYSTCYWCHVMERECFEQDDVASLMNDRFVCIKLDREEHPAIDDVYMTAVQMTTGRGGWPLNVCIEPRTLRPFWGGTYFPRQPRHGLPSWPDVITRLSDAWRKERAGVEAQAERIAGAVREHMESAGQPVNIGHREVSEAIGRLLQSFDRVHGGFGGAPKFPQPAFLELLLDVRPLAGDDSTGDAIDQALRTTLERMAMGGVFDQVGGGFHRYSVDERWLVPHFEKMLYDNASLAAVYARAAARMSDPFFATITRRVLEYIRRELQLPNGTFASAQDAEVDAREGKSYIWTAEELAHALDPDDADLAARIYGLEAEPNFRDPHHPDEPAAFVLALQARPERLAHDLGVSVAALHDRITRINRQLLESRGKRPQPGRDDKAITSWNGLAISALAIASTELDEAAYLDAAERAAEAIWRDHRDARGFLIRSRRADAIGGSATLEDYAYLTRGLLDLARAAEARRSSRGTLHRGRAGELVTVARHLFCDDAGTWRDTPAGSADLFVRAASITDGAMPSASGVMLLNLLELRAHDDLARGDAVALLSAFSGAIADSPLACATALRGLVRLLSDGGTPAHDRGEEQAARGGTAAAGEARASDEPMLPVEVFAGVERITVTRETPGMFRVLLRIRPGYHIAAAEPNPAGGDAIELSPLRVSLVDGNGLAVYADYPPGELFRAYEGGPEALVHRGEVEFDVVVERAEGAVARPVLTLSYQACSQRECLRPTIVELDVAIDAN
ncbi:MAG: thioredoxin domain-containing protein [Phycisphaerales bacterium]